MHLKIPLRQQWFGSIRGDAPAGLVVALALIPEAIAFSIVAGVLKLAPLMRFVSRPVITGFVNALAILIFAPRLPELIGMPWTLETLRIVLPVSATRAVVGVNAAGATLVERSGCTTRRARIPLQGTESGAARHHRRARPAMVRSPQTPRPPSTFITSPVTCFDSDEAR